MQYIRLYIKGGIYFFTVVTYKRRRILCKYNNIITLKNAFDFVKSRYPLKICSIVILPDHIHCIWSLPKDDCDFSVRWRLIKSYFTRNCNEKDLTIPLSRKKKKERTIWQRRFWEHLIRDENDYEKHYYYIYYNPVKHGFVKSPEVWKYTYTCRLGY